MKKVRLAALVLLLIALFASFDLGLLLLYNLVPGLADGLAGRSILQAVFHVFGDRDWTLAKFFFAFEKAAWSALFLLLINGGLALWDKKPAA